MSMIFTHLCRVVAALGAIYGVFILFAAFSVAQAPEGLPQSVIDLKHGVTALFASILLGTVAEISFSVRNMAKPES
jgi:hypothetical protein